MASEDPFPAAARELLQPILGEELQGLYEQFREANPDDHPSLFAVYLKRLKRLNARQVFDVAKALENEINLPASTEPWSAGRYVRIARIGKGGQGEVRLVHDRELGRNVAYKRLLPEAANDDDAVRAFAHEVLITAQLEHPFIVPVYALEHEKSGALAYTMKQVRGHTLGQLLNTVREAQGKGTELPEHHRLAGRLELFLHVCAAIQYAHSRGVVHRDLKPANIMVGPFQEVLVMDWGLAALTSEASDHNRVAGTPGYMSPEQASGSPGAVDPKSDQFALGLILFELVSLTKAYGTDASSTLHRAKSRQLAPLQHPSGTSIRRELAAIVSRATAASPADRYDSVEALADDLRRYLRDDPVVAAPDNALQSLQRWVGRNRSATVAAMLAMLLFMTVGSFASVLHSRNLAERQRAAAAQREQQITELVGQAAERAGQIDASFSRYAGLLEAMAVELRVALSTPAEPAAYHLSEWYGDPVKAPPDMLSVPQYADPVSFGHLVYKVTPPTPTAELEPVLFQLSRMKPAFERLLLASLGPDALKLPIAEQRTLLQQTPSQVVWAYAGQRDGVVAKLPGKGGHPPDYDPRKRDWYRFGGQQPVATWGSTYIDSDGQQLLIPCSMAARDPNGELLGVAAIDLSVDRLVAEFLDLRADVGTTYVLDATGSVMLSSASQATTMDDRADTRFPFADALQGSDRAHAGHLEVPTPQGPRLLIWSEIPVLGWTYVFTAPTQDLGIR